MTVAHEETRPGIARGHAPETNTSEALAQLSAEHRASFHRDRFVRNPRSMRGNIAVRYN
jgi:hypothetical protein